MRFPFFHNISRDTKWSVPDDSGQRDLETSETDYPSDTSYPRRSNT